MIIDYINKIRIKDKNIDIYCLKIDISKYFYSIDHNLLLKMLEEDIEDKSVIDIIKKLLVRLINLILMKLLINIIESIMKKYLYINLILV